MAHSGVARELREEIGLSEALIRVSIGIENVEDLISVLARFGEVDLEFAQRMRGASIAAANHGPCLCGDAARFRPHITLPINKVEKLHRCSCVAESAMMVL